jgi:hypothetical protein
MAWARWCTKLYEAVQSAPAVKGMRAPCSRTGLSDQVFRDGGRVKRPADKHGRLQGPAPPVSAKEHMNDSLIE